MAYVPGFINDIFISYSHFDDQAVSGLGWVAEFHKNLLGEVQEELGEDVRIWRDRRITSAAAFTKDLEKQLKGSAILLAIISPSYVRSNWYEWELTGFAGSRRSGDLWVDTKCRAIKVFKRPADVSRLRRLAETEGIKFFDEDPATGRSSEIDWSSDLRKDLKQRLSELGNDIGFILRAMRKARTVFLGMASPSLTKQRERVRQELTSRDYRVPTVPDGPPDDRRRSVRAAIGESALSVLFYDRTAPVELPATALAAIEREVALDQRAKQVIVVHGPSDVPSQPWDEAGVAGRGSANVEWLIEPQTSLLYHTVLQMLDAASIESIEGSEARFSDPILPASAAQPEPSDPISPASAAQPEPVEFSAYFPVVLPPSEWQRLLVYVHVASAGRAVEADSGKILPSTLTAVERSRSRASTFIDDGAEIRVVPMLQGCEFNPPSASVLWKEKWHRLEFRVRTTEASQPHRTGMIRFFVGPIIVGDLPLWADVGEHFSDLDRVLPSVYRRRAYNAVFVSYSHEDRVIVDRLEEAYTVLGLDYVRDIRFLRSGNEWSETLLHKIPGADVFQLCWSNAAKASANVEREWRCALKLGRSEFIRPMYWQDPMPVPPSELEHFHFARLPIGG